MGGQSVEDLERVIAAMRRVVERLQGENDQLKKTVGAGGPQYGEVLKENKRLKVRRFLLLLVIFFCLFVCLFVCLFFFLFYCKCRSGVFSQIKQEHQALSCFAQPSKRVNISG